MVIQIIVFQTLPIIRSLRDRVQKKYKYEQEIRVGVGGGIGCPEAIIGAFAMGADFVVTGTVNQISREAGTCDKVRKILSEASYSDVIMAPAADMFEQGVELQVLQKGTFFAQRAEIINYIVIITPLMKFQRRFSKSRKTDIQTVNRRGLERNRKFLSEYHRR